jgi:hypothetical protein
VVLVFVPSKTSTLPVGEIVAVREKVSSRKRVNFLTVVGADHACPGALVAYCSA